MQCTQSIPFGEPFAGAKPVYDCKTLVKQRPHIHVIRLTCRALCATRRVMSLRSFRPSAFSPGEVSSRLADVTTSVPSSGACDAHNVEQASSKQALWQDHLKQACNYQALGSLTELVGAILA